MRFGRNTRYVVRYHMAQARDGGCSLGGLVVSCTGCRASVDLRRSRRQQGRREATLSDGAHDAVRLHQQGQATQDDRRGHCVSQAQAPRGPGDQGQDHASRGAVQQQAQEGPAVPGGREGHSRYDDRQGRVSAHEQEARQGQDWRDSRRAGRDGALDGVCRSTRVPRNGGAWPPDRHTH